ncbi:MAG: SPFH domain-containing protein [Ruminococcaceae bacterium]|nr:SPFH domain-containing protein [Oscillospiraceae bacterium]
MEEKVLQHRKNGMLVLLLVLAAYIVAVAGLALGIMANSLLLMIVCIVWLALGWILLPGLKVLKPQEALVLTLFGKYIGTLKGAGFYWVNPFCTAVNPAAATKLNQSGDVDSHGKGEGMTLNLNGQVTTTMPNKKVSLKLMTLNNARQKINDCLGNPVEIGIAVTWRVVDTAAAVFNVDNYKEYLSLQCDAALRNIVRIYPYDVAPNVDTTGDGHADEGSLRGSSEVVAERIRAEIQSKVQQAGLEIVEARITYLAYAPEIAAVMLQRQQASAIIDARKMIVDGAVGMVELALERLKDGGMVELDEERKAAMVSNLLVVLCGNHDAQPVVNSGSLY